jgi:hypothetical protein
MHLLSLPFLSPFLLQFTSDQPFNTSCLLSSRLSPYYESFSVAVAVCDYFSIVTKIRPTFPIDGDSL